MNDFLMLPTFPPDMCKALPPKMSGCTAADISFNNYFQYFVSLNKTIHDEGESETKLLKGSEQRKGIKSFKIVPYYSMGNGIAERINRTIVKCVKKFD